MNAGSSVLSSLERDYKGPRLGYTILEGLRDEITDDDMEDLLASINTSPHYTDRVTHVFNVLTKLRTAAKTTQR